MQARCIVSCADWSAKLYIQEERYRLGAVCCSSDDWTWHSFHSMTFCVQSKVRYWKELERWSGTPWYGTINWVVSCRPLGNSKGNQLLDKFGSVQQKFGFETKIQVQWLVTPLMPFKTLSVANINHKFKPLWTSSFLRELHSIVNALSTSKVHQNVHSFGKA